MWRWKIQLQLIISMYHIYIYTFYDHVKKKHQTKPCIEGFTIALFFQGTQVRVFPLDIPVLSQGMLESVYQVAHLQGSVCSNGIPVDQQSSSISLVGG